MNKRPWYKWYGMEWIISDTRCKLTHLERSILRELFDLASYNHVLGKVSNAVGKGYSDAEVSRLLEVDVRIWRRTKDKLCKLGCIKVYKNGVIDMTNYWNYQTKLKDRGNYWKERHKKDNG